MLLLTIGVYMFLDVEGHKVGVVEPGTARKTVERHNFLWAFFLFLPCTGRLGP
jgi:hypothetical protein